MPAGFSADAAVFVFLRVHLALVGAYLAGDDTCVQLRMHKFVRALGLTRQDVGRGLANIRAVKVRDDTAPKVREVFRLTETGISA